MPSYPYEKKPAFFRVMSAELFFEAELDASGSEVDAAFSGLNANLDLDAELDAILTETL
jgi:hypothetical protein